MTKEEERMRHPQRHTSAHDHIQFHPSIHPLYSVRDVHGRCSATGHPATHGPATIQDWRRSSHTSPRRFCCTTVWFFHWGAEARYDHSSSQPHDGIRQHTAPCELTEFTSSSDFDTP